MWEWRDADLDFCTLHSQQLLLSLASCCWHVFPFPRLSNFSTKWHANGPTYSRPGVTETNLPEQKCKMLNANQNDSDVFL